ncbi:hypothetical protein ACFQJ8_23145 [Halocatena marina]|uniref:hypothetical protein n=1 Tax=Halocatena marina TaxID=2934937 RepID=UPI003618C155
MGTFTRERAVVGWLGRGLVALAVLAMALLRAIILLGFVGQPNMPLPDLLGEGSATVPRTSLPTTTSGRGFRGCSEVEYSRWSGFSWSSFLE